MKHETTSSVAGEEEGGGTAALQPLPVSDEFISRLAGKCEEIFPLNNRLRRDEISDDEIHEMESLLKRLRPSPARVLFREQCCALMCAESEHEMETRLKRLSASSMLEFSVCKMAQAMNCVSDENRKSVQHPPVAVFCLYFRHFRGCRCGGRHAGSTCSGGARRDGGSRKCRGSFLGKG